jgi:hypothetical protein
LLDLTLLAVRTRLYRARQHFRILYHELDQPNTAPLGRNAREGV